MNLIKRTLWIVSLIGVVVLLVSCGVNGDKVPFEKLVYEEGKYKLSEKLFTGGAIEKKENGDKIIKFKNGEQHGLTYIINKSELIIEASIYCNGEYLGDLKNTGDKDLKSVSKEAKSELKKYMAINGFFDILYGFVKGIEDSKDATEATGHVNKCLSKINKHRDDHPELRSYNFSNKASDGIGQGIVMKRMRNIHMKMVRVASKIEKFKKNPAFKKAIEKYQTALMK